MSTNKTTQLTFEQVKEAIQNFYSDFPPNEVEADLWDMFSLALESETLQCCDVNAPANLAMLYRHLKQLLEFLAPIAA